MIYSIALPHHRYARPGKSVWRTREEAVFYRDLNPDGGFLLWGMHASWVRDTKPSEDGPWNELLIYGEMFELEQGC